MNNALEIKGLNKRFASFALEDVSFDVPQGYICGFIGPNGAGKTTTIKAVLGIIKPDSGSISVFGQTGDDRTQSTGIVMDSPFYVDDWTVADVEKAISPFYTHWDASAFGGYLKRFHLERAKKVKQLSRGMKVKIQLAAALSHNARLLILDEPTSGLDPVARDEVCDILREYVEDERNAVLFSTHITSDLEKTADYITFILNGKIIYAGTQDALKSKYSRVAGGINDLTESLKKRIIGCRKHSTGFEGLIETADSGLFPAGVLVEPATLDEIIIFMDKGAESDE